MSFAPTRDDRAVSTFVDEFGGTVLFPDEDGYEEARTVWNAMIDRRPAVIAQCEGAEDVVSAVTFGRENDLLVAVKGAGHNIAGNAVCDDGLMIDLSPMDGVTVDPESRTATVGPGATLADVDGATQEFGLVVPTGINSTTGIAGLTLGGGFGWLSRAYGLTIDNLQAVDVVTADGDRVHASEDENPDLFWGIRGGGGNFGVVTTFEFDLHEVGPEVLSGFVVYPHEAAADVMRHVREVQADAPDEVTIWPVLRKAPPLPFLSEDVHGTDVIVLAMLYAGDVDEGEAALASVREYGDPIADVVQPRPYVEWQQVFDPLLEEGARNYWKTHNFTDLEDGLIDTLVEYAPTVPTPHSEILVPHLGGAVNRVPPDATAYPHRDVEYIVNVHTRWEDPAQDEECLAWAREFYDALAPYASGGAYVNFISEREGKESLAYDENYERLVELKNEWDPENRFRTNQNVEPTA